MTLDELNEIPPCVYRLFAAEYGKPLGPDEIAKRSGLSRSSVQRISTKRSWNGLTLEASSKFVSGCGFVFGTHKDIRRRLKYVQQYGVSSLKHLNVSKNAPLHRRGALGNTRKFLIKVIAGQV